MLNYLSLLFTCTSALTYEQGRTGGKHFHGPDGRGHHDGQDVDGFDFHNHTVGDKTFRHANRVGGRPINGSFPAEDRWDKELLAKLLPMMKKKPQPYLAYLDLWRLKKGQKSNSYHQEKDRFIHFVQEINRNVEHMIKVALGSNPEAAARSIPITIGLKNHVNKESNGIPGNQKPTFDADAARNYLQPDNIADSAWNPEDAPHGNGNVAHWPGNGEGKVNLLTRVHSKADDKR